MQRPFVALLLLYLPGSSAAQPLSPMPTLHTPDVIAPAVMLSRACTRSEGYHYCARLMARR